MELERKQKSLVGSVVDVDFNGDSYTGVIIAEYLNAAEGQESVCVIPFGEGPYGVHRQFTTMLSSTELKPGNSKQMANFCPVCGEFVADTHTEDGNVVCPTHGEMTVSCDMRDT